MFDFFVLLEVNLKYSHFMTQGSVFTLKEISQIPGNPDRFLRNFREMKKFQEIPG